MKIPKLSLPTNFKISLPQLKKSNDDSDIQIGTLSPAAIKDAKCTKLIRCAIVVLAAVLGFLIFNDHNSNSKTANKFPSVGTEAKKNSADEKNAENIDNKQKKGKLAVSMDIAAINPFVFDAAEDNIMPDGIDGGIQQGSVHRGATASANLPVIPGYQPRPNLPQIPNRNYESQQRPQPQEPAKVQGVFVGGKSNMAIMSDGTVVSEGEYYNDNRISWIGGDGIHFDNGESIKYR